MSIEDRVKRREFITLLGSMLTAWPLTARAQEAGRSYRFGFLLPTARQAPQVEAFVDELRLNGFVEGKNLVVIPGGLEATDDHLAERATALINAAPDAIVAGPAPPLHSTSGHNPDRAARRYVRRHGRGGIGGIARTPRRQHHGSTIGEIDAAFATLERERPDALFVAGDAFFVSRAVQFATLVHVIGFRRLMRLSLIHI